ncbi:uncharacterized protein BX663DRAFT_279230 [Cokeromyces recurvatus]|uniref:uncharacterized protein n=1 Tax=Cokeromyces recurvatus TaxID=90255 RepID=UPI00222081A9|nr:uncharacterized protein BX663DRAFT_279230 [Cokeromyces recurvatus]KAI7897846.1 hypothetical protein BX663DRAFT_279230 [Cokeromyces recurvatus]
MKGGLKGVIDASFNVGSGIANRAGAMYESIKMGLTANLFMRGLGLSRQQIYEDIHPKTSDTISEEKDTSSQLTRVRSNSDPTRFESLSNDKTQLFKRTTQTDKISINSNGKSTSGKTLPSPLMTPNDTYSQGARKLKMLNVTGRVDYCLKEGLLENPYLSAFSAHMQYWQVNLL